MLRSPFETAALQSLELQQSFGNNNNYNRSDNNPNSFARNFKTRLLNVDPDQEKSKELAKENYKRQLEKQVEEQRKRKQDEIRKIKQEDEKYQKAFKMTIQATNNNKKQQPAYFVMRSAQRNRLENQKMQKIQNRKKSPEQIKRTLDLRPPPLLNKENDKNKKIQKLDYIQQQQRLNKIQSFQDQIIRKMVDLQLEIKRSSSGLQIDKEIDKIRGLLKNKSIDVDTYKDLEQTTNRFYQLRINADISQKFFNNKPESTFIKLDESSEPKYNDDIPKASFNKKKTESDEDVEEEQYDKVQVLPYTPPPKQSPKKVEQIPSYRKWEKPKTEPSNAKVDNMLNSLDNMIDYYGK